MMVATKDEDVEGGGPVAWSRGRKGESREV